MCDNPFESEQELDHHNDSADNIYSLIFTRHLDTGETISSVTSSSTNDATLTVSGATVNGTAFDFGGQTVPVGHAVLFELSGGTKGQRKVQFNVLSSSGETLIGIARVRVFS